MSRGRQNPECLIAGQTENRLYNTERAWSATQRHLRVRTRVQHTAAQEVPPRFPDTISDCFGFTATLGERSGDQTLSRSELSQTAAALICEEGGRALMSHQVTHGFPGDTLLSSAPRFTHELSLSVIDDIRPPVRPLPVSAAV